VTISPEDYEKQVVSWLSSAGAQLPKFSVSHLEKVPGLGGEYSLDGWATFEIFEGTKISVLIECKRHGRAVERDLVHVVHSKAQAVKAQKAIIFSTSGFQSGAVEFASSVGIALVVFVSGQMTYETRSAEPVLESSYPPDLPAFAGQFVRTSGTKTTISYLADDRLCPLLDWLTS